MRLPLCASVLLAAAGLLLSGAPASAQTATGRVTDESTGGAVAGAMISLIDAGRDVARRVVTDSAGRYAIEAPQEGQYWLQADFLGYELLESPLLNLERDRTVVVDFELPVDAIELEGLAVEAERNEELRSRVELYGVRVDDLGARWVGREQIERWQSAPDIGVALRAQGLAGVAVSRSDEGVGGGPPRICVRVRSPKCALIVLNGTPISDRTAALVPPMSIEAAVVLRPVEATLSFGTAGGGGAVLLFTRGTSSGR